MIIDNSIKMRHFCWIFIFDLLYCLYANASIGLKDYTQYVNPFIGTQGGGNCFSGAIRPLGFVQPSPETTSDYYTGYEGKHISGYQYSDPYIWGFTQTHLNGVGCPSLSDILLLPYSGEVKRTGKRSDFRSTYKKEAEQAAPGYYAVELITHQVRVELTALDHVAYHRYTYKDNQTAHLLIDLQYGRSWNVDNIKDNVLEAEQKFVDDYTLCGYR